MELPPHGPARCANCWLDIPWRPVVAQGQAYCCGGCAQGGPCHCSYDAPAAPDDARQLPRREEGTDATLHPRGIAARERRTGR
jgi:hypothetical protein